jgi:hypothetical protein
MKNFFLSVMMLLSFNNVMHAMLVRLPDAATLTQRLHGFSDFTEKTKIIQQLASKEIGVESFAVNLEYFFHVYRRQTSRETVAQLDKASISKAFLADFPEAIEEFSQIVVHNFLV